jgi:hypothetical protein
MGERAETKKPRMLLEFGRFYRVSYWFDSKNLAGHAWDSGGFAFYAKACGCKPPPFEGESVSKGIKR